MKPIKEMIVTFNEDITIENKKEFVDYIYLTYLKKTAYDLIDYMTLQYMCHDDYNCIGEQLVCEFLTGGN